MRKSGVQRSDLVCLKCGNVFTISRIRPRAIGHIKDMWCYRCKTITKHYEVQDADMFVCNLYDDKIKQNVCDLIIRGNDNYEGKDRVFKKILTKR